MTILCRLLLYSYVAQQQRKIVLDPFFSKFGAIHSFYSYMMIINKMNFRSKSARKRMCHVCLERAFPRIAVCGCGGRRGSWVSRERQRLITHRAAVAVCGCKSGQVIPGGIDFDFVSANEEPINRVRLNFESNRTMEVRLLSVYGYIQYNKKAILLLNALNNCCTNTSTAAAAVASII